MSVSKMRHLALGLAAAGVMAAGLLAVAPGLRGAPRVEAAEQTAPDAKPADENGSGVRVQAPGTEVNVDKQRGKVTVRAPHTDVDVDPDQGRVQVRAPYVNLDIRW